MQKEMYKNIQDIPTKMPLSMSSLIKVVCIVREHWLKLLSKMEHPRYYYIFGFLIEFEFVGSKFYSSTQTV